MSTSNKFPHCDSLVLHAPGVCVYCDTCPDLQQYRITERINFTGQNFINLAPCPSTLHRSLENIEKWHGNVPKTAADIAAEDKAWKEFSEEMKRKFNEDGIGIKGLK